ncbi:MAG: Maf family protein [Blastocatellia bacterium]|jgi:septum formation protein
MQEGAKLVLASGSPRRAELLRAAGIDFTVEVADVDETPHEGEAPAAYVARLALAKAAVVAQRRGPGHRVLGADTTVVIQNQIIAKPVDAEDARRMLQQLSGQWHEVLTGIALVEDDEERTEVETTRVEFAPLTPAEIDWYVATGEPMDKAGAYGIQGYASRFIERIEGSYANVVGLPVHRVYRLLSGTPPGAHL